MPAREKANASFGISLALLHEAHEAGLSLKRGTVGNNLMYFETGQGSALSADAHFGVDQQTCEVRAYAVARKFNPFLVNTVVGFIGPEYLYDGKQIIRAGLEDHFCGKLLGVPMGCDICYTNHAEADQDDMDNLLTLLGVAGINFIMGIPGADDVMLNYQSTSFHDALYVRDVLGLRRAPEFEEWLESMQITDARGALLSASTQQPLLEGRARLDGRSHERLPSKRIRGTRCGSSPTRASRWAARATACRPRRCSRSTCRTRRRATLCIIRSTRTCCTSSCARKTSRRSTCIAPRRIASTICGVPILGGVYRKRVAWRSRSGRRTIRPKWSS